MDALYPAYSRKQRLEAETFGSAGAATIITGTLTSGSTAVSAISGPDAAKIKDGDLVYGAGAQVAPIMISSHTTSGATLSGPSTMAQVGAELLIVDPTTKLSGLHGAVVRLYKQSLTPTQNTTLADLVAAEADYNGYAEQTLSMVADAIDGAGDYLSESQLLIWQPTDALAPNVIGGLWADDGTGALVIWPLDAPVALNTPTNVLKVVVFEAYLPPGYDAQVLP